MKKSPKKKNDNNLQRLYIRNWVICIVSMGLILLLYFMKSGG